MKRRMVLSSVCAAAAGLACFAWFAAFSPSHKFNVVEAAPGKITQGALQIVGKDGQTNTACPLKQTDVKAGISGSLARVNVTQEFQNPLDEKIEAIYVLPLPRNAAVDDMTMIVGDRTVKGKIKRREEARMIYEAAREAGQVAGLLDQERPNIFTQSVANITPGATVKVTISYVEFLKYGEGTYEFVFPMVVGPRYIPGAPIGQPSEETRAKRGAPALRRTRARFPTPRASKLIIGRLPIEKLAALAELATVKYIGPRTK